MVTFLSVVIRTFLWCLCKDLLNNHGEKPWNLTVTMFIQTPWLYRKSEYRPLNMWTAMNCIVTRICLKGELAEILQWRASPQVKGTAWENIRFALMSFTPNRYKYEPGFFVFGSSVEFISAWLTSSSIHKLIKPVLNGTTINLYQCFFFILYDSPL